MALLYNMNPQWLKTNPALKESFLYFISLSQYHIHLFKEVAPHHLAAVTQPARLVQHSEDSRKPLCNPISRHDPVPWHLFSFTAGDAERARYINKGRVHHRFFIGSLLATCMFYIHVHSEGAGSRCKLFKIDDSNTDTRFKKAIL